jgi:hypothetical protein
MILNFTYILYFKLFSLCHRLEKKNANFNRRWQDGKRKKEEARKKFWCGQSHLNRREFICTIDLTSKWLSMVSLLYIIFNNFIKWDINWLIKHKQNPVEIKLRSSIIFWTVSWVRLLETWHVDTDKKFWPQPTKQQAEICTGGTKRYQRKKMLSETSAVYIIIVRTFCQKCRFTHRHFFLDGVPVPGNSRTLFLTPIPVEGWMCHE